MKIEEKDKLELELLLKDHENRFNEMMAHMERYQSQVNLVHWYISIGAAIVVFLFSENAEKFLQTLQIRTPKMVYGALLVIAVLILYYFVAIMMDALYNTYVNGIRMAAIEKLVNKKMGVEIWVWETKIMADLHSYKWQYKGWIRPNYIVGVWIGLLTGAATLSLIFVWYNLIFDFVWIYSVLVIFLLVFHAHQWILLHSKGVEYVHKLVTKSSGVDLVYSYYADDSKNSKRKKLFRFDLIIPLLTLLLGFIPFLILSISLDAFWVNSPYDFPLVLIPTIFFGDSFMLPLFNYRCLKSIQKINAICEFSTQPKNHKIFSWVSLVVSFLISFVVNSYSHYLWVNDSYTGFMNIQPGKLTIAGWWHYGFSVLQMGIVLFFLGMWFFSVKTKADEAFRLGVKAWNILILFTLLNIPDFIIKHFFIYKSSFFQSVTKEITSFAPLLFSLVVLLVVKKYHKHVQKEGLSFIKTI